MLNISSRTVQPSLSNLLPKPPLCDKWTNFRQPLAENPALFAGVRRSAANVERKIGDGSPHRRRQSANDKNENRFLNSHSHQIYQYEGKPVAEPPQSFLFSLAPSSAL